MSQSATPVYRFSGIVPLPPEASVDGGRLTSDGGLPWLERAEAALGLRADFHDDPGVAARAGAPRTPDLDPPAGLSDHLWL